MNNLINITPLKSSNDIKALRKLYDDIQLQIRSLESLNIPSTSYGNILCPIILKALTRDLVLEFNKENVSQSYDLQKVIDFIYKQLNSRERLNNVFENEREFYSSSQAFPFKPRHRDAPNHKYFTTGNEKQNKQKGIIPSSACDLLNQNKSEKQKCAFCDDHSHESNSCLKVWNLPFEERLKILRMKGVCYKCLCRKNHIAKNCGEKVNCKFCNYNHAEIMCKQRNINTDNCETGKGIKNHALSNNTGGAMHVFLQTLIVGIEGKNGSKCFIRLLIDTGSQNSYVSKFVAEKLGLKKIKTQRITHGLFGGIEKTENHNCYQITLSNLKGNFSCNIDALDQNKICSGVNPMHDTELIKTLEENGINLSDKYGRDEFLLFEENPNEVHLLLGADMAANLFTDNVKHFPNLGLTAFETKLGWTLMGRKKGDFNCTENSLSTLSLSLHVSNSKLTDLWRLDVLGITNEENKTKLILEKETEKHFLETVQRDSTGRYEVSLPWVVDQSVLPSNRSIAEKSLYKTEQKLVNTNMKEKYSDIFQFWESSGIIEEVKDEKTDNVHFLPHHPVIKETSETTPLRPVYNASAHLKASPSLNDCLTKGPNLIEIIPSILNRFRKYRIGVSSDIEKAFLQIKITEKDRDFLRFLWFNEDRSLKIYRHCRVVFGLASSPYLLMATLKHLLDKVPPHLFETAKILEHSFYLDNSLTSLESEQEIVKFMKESTEILDSAHFNLRCWRSNLPMAMIAKAENIPKSVPTLGLMWNLEDDSLFCKIDEKINADEPYTKRKILSIAQKIFDPIGFTTPVTLVPKLILQKTWIQKIKWDEKLPIILQKEFKTWLGKITLLSEIQIPRWLNLQSANKNDTSLHVFSDASKSAYATCVFVRIDTTDGVKVQLVNARSRVAPIRELTIPRLELLSCLIGARLIKTIKTDLQLEDTRTLHWSDSTTALGWIRGDQAWGTFVHNRVSEIRKLTNIEDWRHVPGELNPADLPSRGCTTEQLKLSRWWEGPAWLYLPEDQWPQVEEKPDENLINKERRKTILTLIDKNNENDWYYKYFSSYKKTVRMMAWIYRFYNNSKTTEKISEPDISVEEFARAENVLIRLVQQESFSGKTDPKLRNLRPVEDKVGILRAKTKIIERKDSENFRYPMILPAKHPVVQRLIYEKHLENCHAGVSILMAQLRENFWILKSRKSIRNTLRKCITCKKFQISKIDVEPGIPPEDRVRDAAIFEVVGVDLAGPLHLSDGSKAWITLFTCAVYRAIHLEAVMSLSTESFLQSLRRFIARRGRPYVVYSDNGKNFLGASKALSSVDWEAISKIASMQKIRWKFNPPAAPWWGGWWERLVGMVKRILRRKLGRASLNYEELCTILCDCEQVINSRPITYVSEDNRDPLPLTPMMFLQELPTSGVPDIDVLDSQDLNRKARHRQMIREDLRNRFRAEYLGQLRQHASKTAKFKQLKIGDIVLLEDFNKKRIHWPLAKVIEIYPGKDNVIRLAKVKTENGLFIRPLQRLFPLEIDTTELKNYPSLDKSVRNELSPSTSRSDHIPQRSRLNSRRKESVKDYPESTSASISKEKSPPDDPPSSLPVVTRVGREVKLPQRLQLGLLSSSK